MDRHRFQTCPFGATATRGDWRVPWHLGANLATVERRAIGASLRRFQSAETQRNHARALGQFLSLAGIPCQVPSQPNRAGPLTADVLAVLYLSALRHATGSAVLRALCESALREKMAHLRMLRYRLPHVRRKSLGQIMSKIGMEIATLVFWFHHASAFRSVGTDWAVFRRLVHRLHNPAPTDTTALLPDGGDRRAELQRPRERVNHP